MPKASTSKAPRLRPAPGGPSTRGRLVEAAIDIVRKEGLGDLTTVEITRRAGIAQPGFYKYFRNVDECLEEATTQVLDGMRKTFSAMRRGIKNRNDPDEVAEHVLAVLDAVANDRPFNELIVRYRRDPSTLGKAIRDVEVKIKRDFVEELAAQVPTGFRPEHGPRLELIADLAMKSLSAGIEVVLTDGAGRAEVARDVAEFTIFGTRAVLRRMLAQSGKKATRQSSAPAAKRRSSSRPRG